MTLPELLRERARSTPDRVGYTFLADGETVTEERTYADLDRRARAVAAGLLAGVGRGERALVVVDEGLSFLDALFGCLYAGVLAVPVHPPDPRRLDRTLPRLVAVASDAGVSAVLSSRPLVATLVEVDPLRSVPVHSVDDLDLVAADRWVDPRVGANNVAYLQYTSGSTARPRGVRVDHQNLAHQLADFDTGYDHGPDAVVVSWLPATHDLGLVYGRLLPLWVGCRCVCFPPAAFVERPSRWMGAMSAFRGTHSPSPNFGFDLAARKAKDPTSLDLSSIRVLLNGAEPIRLESESRFLATYAESRLHPHALVHAMGMSEATAKIVSEVPGAGPARFVHVDAAAYEDGRVVVVAAETPGARSVAGNGGTTGDTRVAIVDPDSLEVLPADRVGELWVSGTTVGRGYWNDAEATATTFEARAADGSGPWLRTGDLAFVHDGDVYLSGRLKDLIIVRGQNHHPADLEWTVEQSHPSLRPNAAVAFGLADEVCGERVVVAAEVDPEQIGDPQNVFGAIRAALAFHGLKPRSIVLLPPRAVPKTSSGKVQRNLCRRRFLAGTLPALYAWDAPDASVPEVR